MATVPPAVTNGHMNTDMGGFEPPPSTMAAALINNISTTNKPSRENEQDDLKRFMTEVSDLENSATELVDVNIKLEHKHKLTYVFARAVLERLSHDDPFLNTQQLVSQASEALDIFTSTMREIPAVLGYILKPDESLQARGQEPLWMWLFPRVLTLLGRRECYDLTEKIKNFFSASFQAVAQSPKIWYLNSSFFSYLKECISRMLSTFPRRYIFLTNHLDMLSHLQNPSIIPQGNMIPISSPADDLESSAFSQQKEDSPFPLPRYTISEATHAFRHVSHLLSILVDASVEAVSSFDATPAFQDYLVWMFDSFLAMHDLQKRWHANPELQQVCIDTCLLSFRNLELLLFSVGEELSPAILRKGYLLFSIFCADFLGTPEALQETPDRFKICRGLLNLIAVCKKHDFIRGAVDLHLLPAIATALQDEDTRSKLGNDFQVKPPYRPLQFPHFNDNTESRILLV